MTGRTENRIKTENSINSILDTLPSCVTNYYYSIASGLEPKACLEYIKKIRGFLSYINSNTREVKVDKIGQIDVAKYMHHIETKTDINGAEAETSFAYRKLVHSVLNSFFEYLANNHYVECNPMKQIRRPRGTNSVKRYHLTSESFQKILKQIDSGAGTARAANRQKNWHSRDYAIMVLLMCTGMRETALTEINVGDINWRDQTLTIIDKRYTTHVYHINTKMRDALKMWLFDRESILDNNQCEALFVSNQRKRISADSVSDIVKKYTKEALGCSLSPHKIRSAFCTILYDQTGDIEFVREAVGHRSAETTQRYIVKDGSTKTKSANIINDLI